MRKSVAWKLPGIGSLAISFACVSHLAAAPVQRPEPVLQYLHSDRTYDLSFAAHAPLLAAAGGDGVVDLWSTRDWTKKRSIKVTESEVGFFGQSIALSPDGRVLARCAANGGVELWDTASGKLRRTVCPKSEYIVAVVWSFDGRFIAAAGKSVLLCETASGRLVCEFPGSYTSLCFSRNGQLLGAASDSRADIFEVETGRKVRSLKDKSGAFAPIAVSSHGKLVATAGEDPKWDPGPLPRDEQGQQYAPSEAFYAHELKLKVWDVRTGRLRRLLPGYWSTSSMARTLRFTPDGRRLFSGGGDGSTILDIRTGRAVRSWKTSFSSQLSPDGCLAAIFWNNLSVYRVADGTKVAQFQPPPLPVKSLAFSPDGTRLAVGRESLGTTVEVWDVSAGRLVHALQGPPPNLRDVGFLPASRIVGNSYNGIYVWDIGSAKLIERGGGPTEKDDSGAYHQWAFLTPDGRRMLSSSGRMGDQRVKVWNWGTRRLERVLPPRMANLTGSAVSPDGKYIALPSGIQQTSVTVYNLSTGEEVSQLAVEGKYAVELLFSPDGETIAGYNAYGRVLLCDRATGRLKRILEIGDVRTGDLNLGFSGTGRVLAVAHGNRVRLFDTESGEVTKTIAVSHSSVTALAFSRDDSRLAVGHGDGYIELWDVKQTRLLLTMVGFTSFDRSKVSDAWLAFTPDGFYDWSSSAEKLIRWRLDGKLYPAGRFATQLRRSHILR